MERRDAILLLDKIVAKFCCEIEDVVDYDEYSSKELAPVVQAYVPAHLALLALMKEEVEDPFDCDKYDDDEEDNDNIEDISCNNNGFETE